MSNDFFLAPELFLIVLLGGGREGETGEGGTSSCPFSKELEICVWEKKQLKPEHMSTINKIMYSYHKQDRQRNNRTVSIKTGNLTGTPEVRFSSPNFSCIKVRHSDLDT